MPPPALRDCWFGCRRRLGCYFGYAESVQQSPYRSCLGCQVSGNCVVFGHLLHIITYCIFQNLLRLDTRTLRFS
ncbi:hypothetical protein GIB67_011872 [Kingdonia uniflora]|uniref:Uncharacterized protein n=1 Tax=Kingdonia uniflora TaxID=39325 RepID=A0A7J7KVQ4_9MAGN|nr:hypothetical protein GIB67_011872 [Kingdonia uniflora]